MIKHYNIIGRY